MVCWGCISKICFDVSRTKYPCRGFDKNTLNLPQKLIFTNFQDIHHFIKQHYVALTKTFLKQVVVVYPADFSGNFSQTTIDIKNALCGRTLGQETYWLSEVQNKFYKLYETRTLHPRLSSGCGTSGLHTQSHAMVMPM